MKAGNLAPEEARTIDADELFEMANFYPRTTGLPMTVWLSPRGNARHDVRVKVNTTHGNQINVDNTAAVAARPSPYVIAGQLSPDDERAVSAWITLNEGTIVAYWYGAIDTAQLSQALKRFSSTS